MYSDEFVFADSKTNIFFYFTGDKLLRLAILIPAKKVTSTSKSLSEKYGAPCSSSGQEPFNNVDTKPNAKTFIKWDNDSVI